MNEIGSYPLVTFAWLQQCSLAEFALGYFLLYIVATVGFVLILGVLIRCIKGAKTKTRLAQWASLIFIQVLIVSTFLDVTIRYGSNMFRDGCLNSITIAIFTIGITLCLILTVYLFFKRYVVTPRKSLPGLRTMLSVTLGSLIAALLLYAPIYRSQLGSSNEWMKYPISYRCTILPVQFHLDKTKGVHEEAMVDENGNLTGGVRYHYDADYTKYKYAREAQYAQYCLGLSIK